MRWCSNARWFIVLALFAACARDELDRAPLLTFENYDFSESDHGWEHGFADYPVGPDSALFELKYAYTDQPAESIFTKKSVMLSGKNVNKDLFMYLKKKVTGLAPNTFYTITFNIELGSNCNSLYAASPGSVFLKAGATENEPASVIQGGYYVMNLDKGNEGTAGEHVITLGNIAAAEKSSAYMVLSRNNTMANSPYVAKTSPDGELWLIIGTDSDLEGTNTLFYSRVKVAFSPS